MKKIKILIVLILILILTFVLYKYIDNKPIDFQRDQQSINENIIKKATDNISKFEVIKDEISYINKSNFEITLYDIDFCESISIPDIYEDSVVFATSEGSNLDKNSIYLYDIKEIRYKIIYTVENRKICDTCIGSKFVFWNEYEAVNPIAKPTYWRVCAYNIDTEEIIILGEGKESEGSLFHPRIDNDNNRVVWLEGTEKNEEYIHEIIIYDAENKTKTVLNKLNYYDNPYRITKIRNGYVSYFDIINSKWKIIIQNIDTGEISEIQCDKKPSSVISNGDYLICEYDSHKYTYIYDFILNKQIYIDNNIFRFDIYNDTIVFTKNENVYLYDWDNHALVNLTEEFLDENNIRKDFDELKVQSNKIVSDNDNSFIVINLENENRQED